MAACGNPWEFERPRSPLSVGFGGTVEYLGGDEANRARRSGIRPRRVLAAPYDTPIAGWRGRHANMLRLWSARAAAPDPARGLQSRRSCRRHGGAARKAEAISRFLYPERPTPEGQELRLRQEYFFTSASLQDLVRRHLRRIRDARQLAGPRSDPAQRHASGDRRRRADADPG